MAPNVAGAGPGRDSMRGDLGRAGRDDDFFFDVIRAVATRPNDDAIRNAIALRFAGAAAGARR